MLGNQESQSRWSELLETFKLASLLHDFGHAPFSHAGEGFYLQVNENLESDLVGAVSDDAFSADVSERPKSDRAAPHEIMSALLSLKEFGEKIENRALFARCITGYRHLHPLDTFDYLENILIETLHSGTIDVDRLDYLIRDAFVVGFDSIAIDYSRLLAGLRMVKVGIGYERCFYRSALSVLENVVYARDLEKQWIQAHPVVLYEQELVKHLISVSSADELKSGVSLFGIDALTPKGIQLSNGTMARLISDDDLIVLAKQKIEGDPLLREYFDRRKRRHPIWKSEAQYKMLFEAQFNEQQLVVVDKLESVMSDFIDLYEERQLMATLDDTAIDRLKGDLKDLDSLEGSGQGQWKVTKAARCDQLRLLEAIKRYSLGKSIPFDFAVLRTGGFASGFYAGEIGREKVVFSESVTATWGSFSKVSCGLKAESTGARTFFMFHRRSDGQAIDAAEFAEFLISIFS